MKKLDLLTKTIQYICAALMVLITVTTFIQVIRRYLFGSVFFWAEEVAIYSMIWVTFLGAVLCLRYSEHTRIDFFINLLPHRIRKYIEAFGLAACFAFMSFEGYFSLNLLKTTGRFVSTGAKIPMYFVYSCILVSGVLMIPYFIVLIVKKIKEAGTAQPNDGGGNA